MEPPHSRCFLQGKHAPSRVPPTCQRAHHPPDPPGPRRTGAQRDGPRPLPRWKRVALIYLLPVCLAMLWLLGVIIGFVVVCLGGLLLIRLVWP
jgi:hypothetical protein